MIATNQNTQEIRADLALQRIQEGIEKAKRDGVDPRVEARNQAKARMEQDRRIESAWLSAGAPFRTEKKCHRLDEKSWMIATSDPKMASKVNFFASLYLRKSANEHACWRKTRTPRTRALALAAPMAPAADWIILPDGRVLDNHFCPTAFTIRQVREIGGKLHYFVQRDGKSIPGASAPTANAAWELAVVHYGGES